jgi:hypothetical protein
MKASTSLKGLKLPFPLGFLILMEDGLTSKEISGEIAFYYFGDNPEIT